MKYSDVLEGLYCNDLNKTIGIVRLSVDASQIIKTNENLLIIHSGFCFKTHKNTDIEILIGLYLSTNKIVVIRQNKAQWSYKKVPLINGLILTSDGRYIDKFDGSLIINITESTDDYHLEYDYIKDDPKYFESKDIKNVELIRSNISIAHISITTQNSETIPYPFQKTLHDKIFLNGAHSSKYLPIEDYTNDLPFKQQGYEDWLKNEFGEDDETAYWNNE